MGRRFAVRFAAYGNTLGRPLTYLEECWLDLNLGSVLLWKATAVALGQWAAGSNAPLDRAWAEAVSRGPEAADDLAYEMNSDRAEARAKAKAGF